MTLPRLSLLATAVCLCTQAEAVNITVTNSADAGEGTLRAAIAAANPLGRETIDFDPALDGATIFLDAGELVIDKDLPITGLGATRLAIVGDNERVFCITGPAYVTISGLHLQGNMTGAPGADGTPSSSNGQPGSPALGAAPWKKQVAFCMSMIAILKAAKPSAGPTAMPTAVPGFSGVIKKNSGVTLAEKSPVGPRLSRRRMSTRRWSSKCSGTWFLAIAPPTCERPK